MTHRYTDHHCSNTTSLWFACNTPVTNVVNSAMQCTKVSPQDRPEHTMTSQCQLSTGGRMKMLNMVLLQTLCSRTHIVFWPCVPHEWRKITLIISAWTLWRKQTNS